MTIAMMHCCLAMECFPKDDSPELFSQASFVLLVCLFFLKMFSEVVRSTKNITWLLETYRRNSHQSENNFSMVSVNILEINCSQ